MLHDPWFWAFAVLLTLVVTGFVALWTWAKREMKRDATLVEVTIRFGTVEGRKVWLGIEPARQHLHLSYDEAMGLQKNAELIRPAPERPTSWDRIRDVDSHENRSRSPRASA